MIEFNGLKFKASFDFKNNKSKETYFNKVLIDSLCKYRNELKKYLFEKLHIIFSYFIVFRVISWIFLGIAVISPTIKLILAIIATLSFIISLILHRKVKNYMVGCKLAISISEMDEIMEEVREDLINENKK